MVSVSVKLHECKNRKCRHLFNDPDEFDMGQVVVRTCPKCQWASVYVKGEESND